jgi:hypothetical protein
MRVERPTLVARRWPYRILRRGCSDTLRSIDHLCNREGESFQRSSVLSQLFHTYPPQYYAMHRCTYQWRKNC